MADVAVLALGLETGQMKSGGDQASRVLDDIQRRFEAVERRSNALKANLQGSGTTIKAAGQHWREFGDQARNATAALSGLGGPIGTVTGKIGQMGGQLVELSGAFGLAAGAVVGLGAALVYGAKQLIDFGLAGAKAADDMVDLATILGVSPQFVQRLGVAYALAGKDVRAAQASITVFENKLGEAASGGAPKLASALQSMGVDATKAGQDTERALTAVLDVLSKSTNQTRVATVATELFGRKGLELVRIYGELSNANSDLNQQLARYGLLVGGDVLTSAGKLADAQDLIKVRMETLSIIIASALSPSLLKLSDDFLTAFAKAQPAIEGVTRGLGSVLGALGSIVAFIDAHPILARILAGPSLTGLTGGQLGPLGLGGGAPGPRQSPSGLIGPATSEMRSTSPGAAERRVEQEAKQAEQKIQEFLKALKAPAPGGGGVSRAATTGPPDATAQQLDAQRRLNATYDAAAVRTEDLGAATRQAQNDVARLTKEMQIMAGTRGFDAIVEQFLRANAKLQALAGQKRLPELKDFGKITLPLPPVPSSITRGIPGVTSPGAAPHPDDVGLPPGVSTRDRTVTNRAADRDRINQEFSFVFEDFIFQIASGRKRVGQAFGDFALGMVDVFASEFARAFQKSLQKAFISPLTNWLEGALSEIFSGISGKGIGKFFGGLFKSVFSGFFAEGGTIPANHFGVVGERGPELAFAGSQPMTITPFGSGGGGNSVSVTFHVNAPGGSLDRRSMDQMSEQVLRAVERGTRNRGV